jgi:hypothetical protein
MTKDEKIQRLQAVIDAQDKLVAHMDAMIRTYKVKIVRLQEENDRLDDTCNLLRRW